MSARTWGWGQFEAVADTNGAALKPIQKYQAVMDDKGYLGATRWTRQAVTTP